MKDLLKLLQRNSWSLVICILFGLLIHLAIQYSSDIQYYTKEISFTHDLRSEITKRNYTEDHISNVLDARTSTTSMLAMIFSAFGVILTFIAFREQKDANNIHREDIKNERLIANYTKLTDFHNDLVKSVTVGDRLQGHGAFHFLYYELKSIYVHLISSYPKMRETAYKDIASYICFKIYMSGCSKKDDSKLIEAITAKIEHKYPEKIDIQSFINDLKSLNEQFIKDRKAPSGFMFDKYNREDFPKLPELYKGQLQRLSSYFNLIDVFMNMKEVTPNTDIQTSLYRQMFVVGFSIHESAILSFYFRYKNIEDGSKYNDSLISLLCDQCKTQFPRTFNIDDEEFCKDTN